MLKQLRQTQKGAAFTETLIVLPIIGLLVGGALQLSFLWEAKSALNHTSLLVARAAAMNSLDQQAMRDAFVNGMLPYYHPDVANPSDWVAKKQSARVDLFGENGTEFINGRFRIVNPTLDAFSDWGLPCGDSCSEIPNDLMRYRDTAVGGASLVNIQDANLVRVQLAYGIEPIVPVVGEMIYRIVRMLYIPEPPDPDFPFIQDPSLDTLTAPTKEWLLPIVENGRIPMTAVATVRMQSPAQLNADNASLILSVPELRDAY
ncbi:MAG TPA: hypothetical protein DCZ03_10715 [Gammaproteobacteria bacterium]|nr:hypothetical protein [Gammaproteobacteria bacterium]